MANEKTIKAATNFLTRCVAGDVSATIAIATAYVDCIEGKEDGIIALIEALKGLQEFCGDLITAIEKEDAN